MLALAEALDIPLRDRNALLVAAGFAPMYRASALDATELRHLRRAIAHMLRQQEPYGAFVIDDCWNVIDANAGAARLLQQFPPCGSDGVAVMANLLLAIMHPQALRPYVVNWTEVAGQLVARLHRDIATRSLTTDEPRRLLATALAFPEIPSSWRTATPGQTAAPFVTLHLRAPHLELQLFSMITSIGTPLDITAEELHVETFFPADDESERALHLLAAPYKKSE